MNTNLSNALILMIPSIIAGVLHMIAVKANVLSFAASPVSLTHFGANKTWRGFILMPVFSILGMLFVRYSIIGPHLITTLNLAQTLTLGLLSGLAFVLFELPNSYMKRKLGITPGKLPEQNKLFFYLVDHTDSATGVALLYLFYFPHEIVTIALMWISAPLIHTVISLLLWALRIRKNPL